MPDGGGGVLPGFPKARGKREGRIRPMLASRDIKEEDQTARSFIDGVIDGPVCLGDISLKLTVGTPVALWLAEEGVRAIQKTEKDVICIKAGNRLVTDMMTARWRKGEKCVIAETDFFTYTFMALPGGNGWSLAACDMLPTARADLRAYLRIFGDFRHLSERGVLPDFYLRDLTAEEIKESGLREGAVLSVSSAVMKEMGRIYKHKKRENKMRAKMNEWRERGRSFSGKPKPKPRKNALVIVQGEKEGEGWNRTNMSNPVHID